MNALIWMILISKIFNFTFNLNDLAITPLDSFYKVSLKGCMPLDSPIGAPELPVANYFIVIDKNEKVDSVKILSSEYVDIEGEYLVYPIQPPQIISAPPNGFVPPDSNIYSSQEFYPGKLVKYIREGYMGGYRLANFSLFPVQYLPSQRKLRLYTYIELEVFTSNSPYPGVPVYRRSKKVQKMWEKIIKSIVYNPEDVRTLNDILIENFKENQKFEPTEMPSIYGNTVECVIIIPDSSFLDIVKPFLNFKIKKGTPTVIKTLDWIYENYDGLDEPDKVRNFLKDAYTYWGTVFCVLIGDKEIMPVRHLFYDRGSYRGVCPSDAYYVGLDGTWNDDGDLIFGEYGERDYEPDIFVGRIVVNNTDEFETFIGKYFKYIKPDSLYQKQALLFGSTDRDGGSYVNVIKDILNSLGFSVTDAVDWWPTIENPDLKDSVINKINKGAIVFHTYHGSIAALTVDTRPGPDEMFGVWDIYSLNNKDKYNIFYSWGCGAGNWSYQYSLSHIWLTAPDKGGIAWLGSTAVNYVGDGYKMQQFCQYLFEQGFYQIGIPEWISKIPASGDDDYYITHQLSGDPEMEVYTDVPESLYVSYPSQIHAGEQDFEVMVYDKNNQPVESSFVCVYKENEVYVYDYTNTQGQVIFTIRPETPGTLYVTATKHNYIPCENFSIVSGIGYAYVRYKSHLIDDDTQGESDGNSNGQCEAFERIELPVTLENVGSFLSINTWARLRTKDPYIKILIDSVFYGTIPPKGSLEGSPFLIQIGDIPTDSDKHFALLELEIHYNGIVVRDNFSLYLFIPNLRHTSHEVLPVGSWGLIPEVTNYGFGGAREVFAYLHTDNPNVTITDSVVYFDNINPKERKISKDTFKFVSTVPIEDVLFTIRYVDYYGKTWIRPLKIKGILGPDTINVVYHSENGIKFLWDYTNGIPSDIRGYDVYRSLNKNGPYERCNNLLIDTIRVFEDCNIAPNTYYYWYVVAVDTFGNKAVSRDTFYSISYFPYQSGFPLDLSPATALGIPPLVLADVDYEHPGEEIIAWWDGKLYLIYGDGSIVSGYPSSVGRIVLPCVCDIDHDGENEIICALRYSSKIRIYEKDGSYTEFDYSENTGAVGISIGDIQKDGKYEIIVVTNNGKLVVLEETGVIFWKSPEYGSPAFGPAIGDIDEDGYLDIVFSSNTTVYAYRYVETPPTQDFN